MGKTSKSPKAVLQAAYQVGKLRLRDYSHRCSPKLFTQPQLFACLVLKEFLRLDYRKLANVLEDAPQLASSIGLTRIPHFTTFQKASKRLLRSDRAHRLLDATVDQAVKAHLTQKRVHLAAVDGTGFESRHISSYFVKRRAKGCKNQYQTTTYTRYPYAVLVCDCASHFVLAVATGQGPGSDIPYFKPTVSKTARRARVETLLADAGFDSEDAHKFAREQCNMRTLIPPTRGRPTDKLPS